MRRLGSIFPAESESQPRENAEASSSHLLPQSGGGLRFHLCTHKKYNYIYIYLYTDRDRLGPALQCPSLVGMMAPSRPETTDMFPKPKYNLSVLVC